jgi:FG-GAP repeat/FG-GAP-like repeat
MTRGLVAGGIMFLTSCVTATEFTPAPPSMPQLLLPRNDVYEGSVHTGSLRPTFVWEASTSYTEDPLTYELQYSIDSQFGGADVQTVPVDQPTYQPPSPLSVSMVPPVGQRYYWRVRACNLARCSGYSPPRWVNLGRSLKDFNGDGYADVAVGSYGERESRGAVYVYFGGPGAFDTTPDAVLRETAETGGKSLFGVAIAPAGDFNADGYGDLIVGASHSSSASPDGGAAYLYYGGPGTSLEPGADVTFPGLVEGGRLGASVASAGDVNGDGFSDVIVGAPTNGQISTTGHAYLYFGGVSDLLYLNDGALSGTRNAERFGLYVSGAGDLDGDGYADLTVSSELHDGTREVCSAKVFRGAAGELFEGLWMKTLIGRNSPCSPRALQAGDINRDGLADLLVGVAPYSASAQTNPLVSLRMGNRNLDALSETAVPSVSMEMGAIWNLASAGDLNGDGFGDVLVCGSYANSRYQALLFLSSEAGLHSTPAATLKSTSAATDAFGHALGAPGDLNGDGFDDLVIGSAQYGVNPSGEVYLYFGNPGRTIDPTADAILTLTPAQADFGSAVL